MTERGRELVAVGVVAAAIGLGVGIDALAGHVREPRTAPARGTISARAVFCPPTSGDDGSILRVSGAAEAESGVSVGIEDHAPEPADLPPGASLVSKIGDRDASDVVGYGAPVGAGGLVSASGPVAGAAASGCPATASSEWYFAAGSAALDSDQRILLYNPFPDEAVVRLTLYTPRGIETKTSLQEVPVPARSVETVAINEAIRVRGIVGTRVVAKRGRVVAWRETFTKGAERPSGVQLSDGVPGPRTDWYFADGAIGPGVAETISLLNPAGTEAIVSVTVATSQETLQPQKLLELPVPRRSAIAVPLEDYVGEPDVLTGASVTVRSTNGVAVAAERVTEYATDGFSGATSEPGAPSAASRWLLPAAAAAPRDDAVALMNPGSRAVSVDLTVLTEDGRRRPQELRGIELEPGSRRRVPVEDFVDGRPLVVVAEGSGSFVAERFAYSPRDEDPAAVRGVPLTEG